MGKTSKKGQSRAGKTHPGAGKGKVKRTMRSMSRVMETPKPPATSNNTETQNENVSRVPVSTTATGVAITDNHDENLLVGKKGGLPTQVSIHTISQREPSDVCSVCLGSLSLGDGLTVRLSTCHHSLHAVCMGRMAKHAVASQGINDMDGCLACPMCRCAITKQDMPMLKDFIPALQSWKIQLRNTVSFKDYLNNLVTSLREKKGPSGHVKFVSPSTGLVRDSYWKTCLGLTELTMFLMGLVKYASRMLIKVDEIDSSIYAENHGVGVAITSASLQNLIESLYRLGSMADKAIRFHAKFNSLYGEYRLSDPGTRGCILYRDLEFLNENVEDSVRHLPIEDLFVLMCERESQKKRGAT